EDLAGLLVGRRVAVGTGRVVGRLGCRGDAGCCVRVAQPVGAFVPLAAAVGSGPDEIVVLEVDGRRRAGVGGLVRRAGRRVVDGEPLPVGAGAAVATEEVLLNARAAVGGGRDAQASKRVEVGKVLLAGAVEVEV